VNLFIIIASMGLIFGILGTIIGLVALVKVLAAEKSTHSVTYMPMDKEIDRANDEFLKESWATKESMIAKDRKEFQEDLETEMPEFFPDDDDREIHSF
jgi:hypothetical protein